MIEFDDLVGINKYICFQSRQESVILNKSNLLSALSVQQWYDSLELRASAVIRSITIGHGFQDGNKRTAAAAGNMLEPFRCTDDDVIRCILAIATGQLREVSDIAQILYKR